MKENRGLGKSPTGVFARPHLITHSTTPNHGDWFASHKWDDSEWFRLALDAGATPSNPTPHHPLELNIMNNNARISTAIGVVSLTFGITALCGALNGNALISGGFASAAVIAGLAAGICAWRGRGDD